MHTCKNCGHEISGDDGLRTLRAEYYTHVRDTAKDLHDRYRAGDFATRDDLITAVHEDVDGDHWVIYTRQAQIVAMVSDNDGAFEDVGTDGIVSDGTINWSAIAYWAMERDVFEALEAGGEDWEGIDVNAEVCGDCNGSGITVETATASDGLAKGHPVVGHTPCETCDGRGHA